MYVLCFTYYMWTGGADLPKSPAMSTTSIKTSGRKASKRKKMETSENDLLEQAGRTLEAIRERGAHEKREDEFDIFGKFVAVELCKIENKGLVRNAKWIISNAILDAQASDYE